MILRDQPPLHLTYCLNVHPGELWSDNFEAIQKHALVVRERVAPGRRFGLGLRLSRQAVDVLGRPETLRPFTSFLEENGLYVFTVNGFPYGNFHGKPVKTEVYRPDWATRERLDYTVMIAETLAQLLPEGLDGSISTLPLGYPRLSDRAGHDAPRMQEFAKHLAECALALHALRDRTGREVHLGLEPEPDCILETTDDVIRFFEGPLFGMGLPALASRAGCTRAEAEAILRRHIGVCVDTCHLAIQYESLPDSLMRLEREGVRISKVQLSAALQVRPDAEGRKRLRDFIDPVYLHQVKAAPGAGPASRPLTSFPDLADGLSHPGHAALWRIHFHLPLYYTGDAVLQSTAGELDPAFWSALARSRVSHWEIETYTFNVLPSDFQAGGVEASVGREYDWVLAKVARA